MASPERTARLQVAEVKAGMDAFDKLPVEVREFLQTTKFAWEAGSILELLARGRSVEQVIGWIREWERKAK